MTEKLTPVEYFAEMIARKDNISVYEWNYLVDKANDRFKDAIYKAFENGKECGMQIEASYNDGKDYNCISDGMRYYENEFGGNNEQ